jgi:hypothetical protein
MVIFVIGFIIFFAQRPLISALETIPYIIFFDYRINFDTRYYLNFILYLSVALSEFSMILIALGASIFFYKYLKENNGKPGATTFERK